jgi:hypothetical protein
MARDQISKPQSRVSEDEYKKVVESRQSLSPGYISDLAFRCLASLSINGKKYIPIYTDSLTGDALDVTGLRSYGGM